MMSMTCYSAMADSSFVSPAHRPWRAGTCEKLERTKASQKPRIGEVGDLQPVSVGVKYWVYSLILRLMNEPYPEPQQSAVQAADEEACERLADLAGAQAEAGKKGESAKRLRR